MATASTDHKPTVTHLIYKGGQGGLSGTTDEATKVEYSEHGITAHIVRERYDGESKTYAYMIYKRFYPYTGFDHLTEVAPVDMIKP